jgi:myosin heavy subunit
MERMCASHPVFMRCLKPNQQKQAHLFDETFVRAQVKEKIFFIEKNKIFVI